MKMLEARVVRLLFSVLCTVSSMRALHVSEPFVAIDVATQKLAHAFQRLLHDASSVTSLSEFTGELASSAIRLLENVPPPMVVDSVEKQTKSASDTHGLPNPSEESCSRDYTAMCPDNWIDIGDGVHCKAQELYGGPCSTYQDFSGQTPRDKKSFAIQCGVAWPCRDSCIQDYSFSCPETWTDLGEGECQAVEPYTGKCVRRKNFGGFDSDMKRKWAEECSIKWPCVKRNFDFSSRVCPINWTEKDDGTCTAPASYLGPCALTLPIGALSDNEKLQLSRLCKIRWPGDVKADFDMSAPCPSGWAQMSQAYSDCEASPHYEGPCVRIQSFEGLTDEEKLKWGEKCGVSWPFKEETESDYDAYCPELWHLSEGVCVAPSIYDGQCEPRFNFQNYTHVMKAAWAHACSSHWPILSVVKPLPSPLPLEKQTIQLNPADEGPVSPETGTVLRPPSNDEVIAAPPVVPDDKTSALVASGRHVEELRQLKEQLSNTKLSAGLEDAIERLHIQGGNGELAFATSFLQRSNSVILGAIQPVSFTAMQRMEDMLEAAEDTMTGNVLSNPEKDCTKDYNNCPEGWQNLDDEHCLAPESYVANGGACNPIVALREMVRDYQGKLLPDVDARKAWEERCGAKFPCANCNHDYVTAMCPSGWRNMGSGYCKAPADYSEELKSRCGDMINFAFASPQFRRSWAQICGADWPCFSDCEPDFSYPCPLGFELTDGKCSALTFRSDQEEANCQSPIEVPDDPVAKRDIALQCGVSWPCLNQCKQNYSSQYCPYGWTLTESKCTAPSDYRPPLGCSTFIDLTLLPKNKVPILAHQCHAPWPCEDDCERDWTSPCPYSWNQVVQGVETFCSPNGSYEGPCASKSNLTGYTFAQKQDFAFRCQANWPCGGTTSFGLRHNYKWQTMKAYTDQNWLIKKAARRTVLPPFHSKSA